MKNLQTWGIIEEIGREDMFGFVYFVLYHISHSLLQLPGKIYNVLSCALLQNLKMFNTYILKIKNLILNYVLILLPKIKLPIHMCTLAMYQFRHYLKRFVGNFSYYNSIFSNFLVRWTTLQIRIISMIVKKRYNM